MTMDFARLWHALAGKEPDRPALIHGKRTLTWRQFDDAVAGFAETLQRDGVGGGDVVALCLPNGPEYLICVAGALRCGAIPCGIKRGFRPEDLAALMHRIQPAVVCYDVADVADVAQAGCQLPIVRKWYAIEGDTLTAGLALPTLSPNQSWFGSCPADVLLLQGYSGVASGHSNAVRWHLGDLLTQVHTPQSGRRRGTVAAVQHPTRLLLASSMVHAAGLTQAVGALSAGGAVITLPTSGFDAHLLLDMLVHEEATSLAISGDVHARPLAEALEAEPSRWQLEHLSIITSSGTAWSQDIKRRVLEHQPHLRLLESVGSTEAPGLGFSVATTGSVPPTGEFTLGRHAGVFTEGRRAQPGETGALGVSWPRPVGLHPDGHVRASRFVHHGGTHYLLSADQARMVAPRRFVLLTR
ncbi:AMP-binding protein (plasmid) [Micromonospora zamorensis]|uniref:AMP-binding protein n=1 Tax=Micromonospora zamorensis TaxID=709883 RepID=UPI002E1DEB64